MRDAAAAERRLAVDRLHHRQREPADCNRAGTGAAVESARRHVAVSDRFDLVDLISFAELIECAHEPIKKVDDLLG